MVRRVIRHCAHCIGTLSFPMLRSTQSDPLVVHRSNFFISRNSGLLQQEYEILLKSLIVARSLCGC